MLSGKTIILGVSSSIAAYKSCEIVSRLIKFGADVWVVMTKEAANLVTPLTFRTLSGNPVIMNLFDPELSQMPVPHISLAKKADLIVIAPCTANVIGKLANGIADDPLTTIVMASTAPKLLAPAMNSEMWRNSIVQENIGKLSKLGFQFVGPAEGKLACGDEDIGRLVEGENIIGEVLRFLDVRQDLQGRNFLITAGGTREAIDPVRYITNHSSGKMGYALAKVARERGAKVTLISANSALSAPLDIRPVKVVSAKEMLEAVLDFYKQTDAVVMAAAVADYTPKEAARNKIKKLESRTLSVERRMVELMPTADILKTLAKQKGRKDKVHVGFALETEDLIVNARKKLKEKDLDLIVANKPATFDSEQIEFSLIDSNGESTDYPRQRKEAAAGIILERLSSCFLEPDIPEHKDR